MQHVFDRLSAAGCGPNWSAENIYSRCPAHDDRKASLSVSPGDEHPVLVKCHADCDLSAILAALDIPVADVMGDSERQESREVARYPYESVHGTLIYDTVRHHPKRFLAQAANGEWKVPPAMRVPYRLPDLLVAIADGQPVYITEGEKDADAVTRAGAVATTNAFGAGKWLDQYDKYFVGAAEVRLVAHRDIKGAKHMLDVARHLRPVVDKVTLLLPAIGKDAAEHLGAGKGLGDFLEVDAADLHRLAIGGNSAEPAPEPAAPAGIPNVPAEFWDERPVLGRIRDAAHARYLSADAVLHAVLARVSACTPHTVELPPIVGSAGSLNVYTSPVGPPGSGKSGAIAVSRELVEGPEFLEVREQPLGSGEGIAEAYMGTVPTDHGKERRQVRYQVLITADEGEALEQLASRQGSTLAETLRRGWTADLLGQANASAETTRVIPARGYRLSLIIGLQPTLAGWLLGDAAGGTPQRFCWAAATDPAISVDPPAWPGGLCWHPPSVATLGGIRTAEGRHRLGVADEIRREVIARRVAGGQPGADDLDAHSAFARLKLAALLALLEQRARVTVDDWRLAGVLWDTSCAVRTYLRETSEDAAVVKLEEYADRQRVGAAARQGARNTVFRVASLLRRHVLKAATPQPRSDLRRSLPSRDRPFYDSAIDFAVSEGWLTDSDGRISIPSDEGEI